MPAGRPPKYEKPEEMQRIIDLYFLACRAHQTGDDDASVKLLSDCSDDDLLIINDIVDIVPAMSGLAYTLGMSTRAFREYKNKNEFLPTVKAARQRVEMSLEQRLAGHAVTGAIFNLKNNFEWKDKTETALTGPNGGPIETKTLMVKGVEPGSKDTE